MFPDSDGRWVGTEHSKMKTCSFFSPEPQFPRSRSLCDLPGSFCWAQGDSVSNARWTVTMLLLWTVVYTIYCCYALVKKNFVLILSLVSNLFSLFLTHYHTQKQRKIQFKAWIKLNHSVCTIGWCEKVSSIFICCRPSFLTFIIHLYSVFSK